MLKWYDVSTCLYCKQFISHFVQQLYSSKAVMIIGYLLYTTLADSGEFRQ